MGKRENVELRYKLKVSCVEEAHHYMSEVDLA